jgi:hypothetical protein
MPLEDTEEEEKKEGRGEPHCERPNVCELVLDSHSDPAAKVCDERDGVLRWGDGGGGF